MSELWLPIAGTEGYFISDLGRAIGPRGWILKPQPNSKGYLRIWLGRGVQKFVHHLVLNTFEGEAPPGLWALHRDDDHSNNAWSNLYYGTPTQNAADMIRNGKNRNVNKTECVDGHEFTPENTLPNGPNGRGCRECGRRRSREYMRRKANERRLAKSSN